MSNPNPNPQTQFKRGQPRPAGAGRQSGKLGQRTELINEAMVRATEELGFVREVKTVDENGKETTELQYDGDGGIVGFLKWAALNHTAAFLAQFGRLIPAQMNVRSEKTVDIAYRSFEEVLVDLKATGLTDEKIELLLEDLRPKRRDATQPALSGNGADIVDVGADTATADISSEGLGEIIEDDGGLTVVRRPRSEAK